MKIKTLEKLEVPAEKNIIFTSPPYSDWKDMFEANQATDCHSQDRLAARKQLLHIARRYTSELLPGSYQRLKAGNIVATGHQPIWHHPGILAKNIMASEFAKHLNGLCIHLVVDHDIGDSGMILPFAGQEKTMDFIKIPVEKNQRKIPFELRSKPDLKILNSLIGAISEHCPENFCCRIWSEHLKKYPQIIFSLKNEADIITSLQAVLNNSLGIEMLYLPTSQMSQSESFMRFISGIIKEYEKFTNIYNEAVLETSTHGDFKILSADNSGQMPLPFWLVTASGLRSCLYVKRTDSSLITISTISRKLAEIDLDGNTGGQLEDILRKNQLSLRPKAITMMLFVRLFLSDLFVHGTGGGIYEKITDFIMAKYYGLEKKDTVIVTATAALPRLKQPARQYDMKNLKQDIHKVHHCPEKYIDKGLLKDDSVKKSIEIKNNMIRLACDPRKSAKEKKQAWQDIKKINLKLIGYAQPFIKKLEKNIQLAKQFQQTAKVLNYREFFFGLFPERFLRDFSDNQTDTLQAKEEK